MLKVASRLAGVKRIVLESRPEFITTDILCKISKICKNKVVEIGIGLETVNDEIRSKCINKGFKFLDYVEAVWRIKEFSNLKVLTYLTVKPLFLTIEESLNDVVKSMIDICDYTDIISLEPVSIQKNTVVDYLYELGIYQPPKGWMIKEIVQRMKKNNVQERFELRIGGFEFFPIPDKVISNCEKCNKELYSAIDSYNASKNEKVIEQLVCECYTTYLEEKEKEKIIQTQSISQRIDDIVHKILLEIVA
jgi:radical SAM enzyme (TIGR01210 family)